MPSNPELILIDTVDGDFCFERVKGIWSLKRSGQAEQLLQSLDLGADGKIVYMTSDGTSVILKLDGSIVELHRDKQDRDKVTRVVLPNGQDKEYVYDDRGTVIERMDNQGHTWKSEDGWQWVCQDGRQSMGFVTVAADGSVRQDLLSSEKLAVIETTDGDTTELWANGDRVILHGDGTEVRLLSQGKIVVRKPDGSEVVRDNLGRVVAISYANGSNKEVDYSTDGKLAQIKDSNGTLWICKDKDNWNISTLTGQNWQTPMRVSIDASGVLTWCLPDGCLRQLRTDGEYVEMAAS